VLLIYENRVLLFLMLAEKEKTVERPASLAKPEGKNRG